MAPTDGDAESLRRPPAKTSHWSILLDQAGVDDGLVSYRYPGHGTAESPYRVDFLPGDARNPVAFPRPFKWLVTCIAALSTLGASFASSAYSGAAADVAADFGASSEVVTLGVSMFVLGFAVGPLVWAPLSELFGRQKLFLGTYMGLAAFNAGAAVAPSMAALVVLRFLAGAFGSSPLTNAGGVIADMFSASERGVATSFFAMAPFLGPALGASAPPSRRRDGGSVLTPRPAGPIAGGFLGEAEGWRWVQGMVAIFTGVLWIVNSVVYPETYAPVLLRRRAAALSAKTGRVYVSKLDAGAPGRSFGRQFGMALSRPWALLVKEPIVLLTSLYMAIIYGTLYMCFTAFPIVFQRGRGWSPGVGGLAFAGIAVGMLLATVGTMLDNGRYKRAEARAGGKAPPEARLPPAMVGSVLLPVGLFWFAWTNGTGVHWVVPIAGSALFASGIVLVFLSSMDYLIDS